MSASALSTAPAGTSALRRVRLIAAEIRHGDVRQQLQLDLEFQVLGRAGAGGIGGHQVDFGMLRRAQVALGQHFWVASLTDSSSTSAATALPKRWRTIGIGTLPGRKPGRRNVLPRSVSRAVRRDSMSAAGHDHREAALQAVGKRLGNLHLPDNPPKLNVLSSNATPHGDRWCGRRDLNPHGLRHQNLNLACLPIPPRPRGQFAGPRDRERGALAQGRYARQGPPKTSAAAREGSRMPPRERLRMRRRQGCSGTVASGSAIRSLATLARRHTLAGWARALYVAGWQREFYGQLNTLIRATGRFCPAGPLTFGKVGAYLPPLRPTAPRLWQACINESLLVLPPIHMLRLPACRPLVAPRGRANPRARLPAALPLPSGAPRATTASPPSAGRWICLRLWPGSGPRRWPPWRNPPVAPAPPGSACCARWRRAASPSRTRRAASGAWAPVGPCSAAPPSSRVRWPPPRCRSSPASARRPARTSICASATAWRARPSRSTRPIPGCDSIVRSGSAGRCMPAPAGCCWRTRRRRCRPRCWRSACRASPPPRGPIPPGSPPTCNASAPAATWLPPTRWCPARSA